MTYHAHRGRAQQQYPRPLIDLVPLQPHRLDGSASDSASDSDDDESLLSIQWQTRLVQTSNHVPRRVRRHWLKYMLTIFLVLLAWWFYVGHIYTVYTQEMRAMDETAPRSYGSNALPQFKDMIMVSNMDERHLPRKNKRLVFVGDVHGCKDELEDLLKTVKFDDQQDHLVLLGDMVAKGSNSPGVIDLARRVGASCVRGNWEDKLLLTIAEMRSMPESPLANPLDLDPVTAALDPPRDTSSADKTSPSEAPAPASQPSRPMRKLARKLTHEQIAFLQSCPVIIRCGTLPTLGPTLIVHAGLVPDTPLEAQNPGHCMSMRTIDLKTRIPSHKHHDGTPWEKFWNYRQEKLPEQERTSVVYGHNKRAGLNLHKWSYGLDTGCVYGGKLTALVVGEKGTEVVQVKCREKDGYDK